MFERMPYKILGATNDVTVCNCCGRENLKKTVVLDDYEGNVKYFGETCAAKAMQMKSPAFKKIMTSELKERVQNKEAFIANHPITIEIREETNELNKMGMPFKERKEKGYLKKWSELRSIVDVEANNLYQFI